MHSNRCRLYLSPGSGHQPLLPAGSINTASDVPWVVDCDWIIASVLRIICARCFPYYSRDASLSGYEMANPPLKKLAPKRKCKFNDDWWRDVAWIAKLPDNGMAQCNLCVRRTFRYRLVVARMFAGTIRVHATLSGRRVRALRSLRRALTLRRRVG